MLRAPRERSSATPFSTSASVSSNTHPTVARALSPLLPGRDLHASFPCAVVVLDGRVPAEPVVLAPAAPLPAQAAVAAPATLAETGRESRPKETMK